jgi:hypothetical protein
MQDSLRDVSMAAARAVDKFVMNIEQITTLDEEDMEKSSSTRNK